MDRVLENKMIEKMKKYFDNDKKYIEHTLKVLDYAKEISRQENGESKIVFPAAIFHDIGIKPCEKKYNSIEGQLQEIEGPPITRKILNELKIDNTIIDEVCNIVASHHSLGEINTLSFMIIWDADWLVNLRDEYDIDDKKNLEKVISGIFQTKSGKKIAQSIYL